jgi:bacterioferritin
MKGHKEVIEVLNEVLAGELVAINQYFLHYRMCDNWGFKALAAKIRHESIDEMTPRCSFSASVPRRAAQPAAARQTPRGRDGAQQLKRTSPEHALKRFATAPLCRTKAIASAGLLAGSSPPKSPRRLDRDAARPDPEARREALLAQQLAWMNRRPEPLIARRHRRPPGAQPARNLVGTCRRSSRRRPTTWGRRSPSCCVGRVRRSGE